MRPMTVALPTPRQHLRSRSDTDDNIGLQLVEAVEGFDALRTEWNGLVDGHAAFSPFQSWEWNRIWWKHLGGNDTLQIVLFRRNRELIGIAPFYRRRYGVGGVGPTTLIPIGSHHHMFGLTEQWELLFRPDVRTELFAALSRGLAQRPWSLATLPGLAESDQLPDSLGARALSPEHQVLLHSLDLPPTWDEFLGRLSKNLRKNIRRYPQRLTDDNYQLSFRVAETPTEVAAALPNFLDLHRARAAAPADEMGVRHTDRFRFANRRAFLSEVAVTLAARGQFKIGILETDRRVVACETWFEKDDVMYLYHSGVAPDLAEYSVGFITTLEVFQQAIRRGVRRAELLRGEGHYKDRWRATPATRRTVIVARHPRLMRMAFRLRRRIDHH
jgi:CelD/BcsL family acetyltransferase involved in cellulose biosynthesis